LMEELTTCALFAGLSKEEIQGCLTCSKAKIVTYGKKEMIFLQTDPADRLMILLEGTVVVGSDTKDGRRSIVATFDRPGELFGEVFLFLNRRTYDHYAQADTAAKVLQIPKEFLYHPCGKSCDCHSKLISNMLSILAQKAYFLNQRLQIMSCATLRQKIAAALLQNVSIDGKAVLTMTREEFADYLNAARPSVSRELMKMQEEGLLRIHQKNVYINPEKLREIL
jgi:CRP-like cAMP-binding protein